MKKLPIIIFSLAFLAVNPVYSAATNEEPGFEMDSNDTLEHRGPGGMDLPQGNAPKPTPKPKESNTRSDTPSNSAGK